jgi:hypothetical protein
LFSVLSSKPVLPYDFPFIKADPQFNYRAEAVNVNGFVRWWPTAVD